MVKRRKHGYLEALREAGVPIDRDLVVCGKIEFAETRDKTLQMLQSANPPDAILALNDIVTYAAFDAIKSLNLHIPQDVAIIGLQKMTMRLSSHHRCRPLWTRLTFRALQPANCCCVVYRATVRFIRKSSP